jgi:hypothetical protein
MGRLDRIDGARVISQYFFPISARTLEAWPLSYKVVNGRAICRTEHLLAHARMLLEAAPEIRGGRQPQSRRRSGDA